MTQLNCSLLISPLQQAFLLQKFAGDILYVPTLPIHCIVELPHLLI